MPIFSRKQLRRDLATFYTRDISFAGRPAGGTFALGGSVFTVDTYAADVTYSGENRYQGAWLFREASQGPNNGDTAASMYEFLIATFNAGSGAFLSNSRLAIVGNVNDAYEVHTRVRPLWKQDAIDETVRRLRLRREVGINTVDGALFYTIDGAASPYLIDRILDVHLATDPSNSQNLNISHVDDWQVVTTATGNVLRLPSSVQASQQLFLDAILVPTLAGGELATINIPDERWVLAGAAVKCYDFMIQDAPGQQVGQLQQRRAEAAAEFSRLSTRFAPEYVEPIRLHDVVRGRPGW